MLESSNDLPTLDFDVSILASAEVREAQFGKGLLTELCRQHISDPQVIKRLRAEEEQYTKAITDREETKDTEGDEEDEITFGNDDDGVEIQEVPEWDDTNEDAVFEGNREEAVMQFMAESMRPVIEAEILQERLMATNTHVYTANAFRRNQGPTMASGYSKQTPNYGATTAHTNWELLRDYMYTDDDNLFKCPLQECDYLSTDIAEVQSHCLLGCSESSLFQSLKDEHDTRPSGGEGPYRVSLRSRQLAEKLEMGYQFQAYEIPRMDWWVDLNDEKVEEIAELCSLDPEEIRVYMPDIREFMGTARRMMTNEGVLYASNVNGNPNEVLRQYMERPSTRQRMRDLFARVEAGERPRPRDANTAPEAYHGVVQTDVSTNADTPVDADRDIIVIDSD
ncbi:myosin-2 heavy chain, non muscle [Ceratobasidium sp. AG-Ba]|nr:myosin-2 heavy chain, non muscle [Ceratobasidium sp. AG-Ba]QRW15295.1 myosin-2 heavy chain, non muscle [Ceratobasidium sp. AG-Ba]